MLMRPMSLYESGESNGQISIMDLFDNPDININDCESSLTIDDLIFAACRGGWPDSLNQKTREGKLFENLYAAGAILEGFNPLKEGCGAGVSILSAMYIAEQILSK